MSNNTLDWRVFFGIGLLICGASLGCAQREKPIPFSEYGETIDHLPVVQDLPSSFPIVDEIETKECHVREEMESSARHRLYESQGRAMELGDDEHEHGHVH